MDFEAFRKQYFRFWNVEDLPADNTFDKYQKAYFHEKQFDVEVTDGQLNLDFQGENWACCVSAVVIFPVAQAAQGERFLHFMEAKRRFYFDNDFKRVLPRADRRPAASRPPRTGAAASCCSSAIRCRTSRTTTRLSQQEVVSTLRGEAFAGEYEPLTLAILPLRDLGDVTLGVSDLVGPHGTISSRSTRSRLRLLSHQPGDGEGASTRSARG